MRRKNIAFITNGVFNIGMGHIYRSITLSSKFSCHNAYFFSHRDAVLGIKKLESLNYKVNTFRDYDGLINDLKAKEMDIVINDILDTDYRYISELKNNGFFVVNFEDMGDGSNICDILFNALYEYAGNSSESAYYGYEYECLREDIYKYPIKGEVAHEANNILIGFGGTDINNATQKVLKALDNIDVGDKKITVILGIGYKHEKEIFDFIGKMKIRNNITVYRDVLSMAKYIYEADLVISGNGRMVYEVVSIGTPLIVCSQNERELLHTFYKICPGIKYVGDITNIDEKILEESLKIINNSYEDRKKMNAHIVDFSNTIRNGMDRVVDLIWDAYHNKTYYKD